MGRVIVLTRSSGSPPPLWNAPLQSIMDGHLSYSSYSHGMHLLNMRHCNTHNSQLRASHGMTKALNVVSTVCLPCFVQIGGVKQGGFKLDLFFIWALSAVDKSLLLRVAQVVLIIIPCRKLCRASRETVHSVLFPVSLQ